MGFEMVDDLGLISLIPSVLSITMALWTKRVLPALFIGVIGAQIILNVDTLHRVPVATLEHIMSISARGDNSRLILFSLLIGALLKLIRDANGFSAFAVAVGTLRHNFGRRTVFGTTYLLGVMLFLEVWSNVLINGATVGPLYDRESISRERMAYFIHTIGIATVAMVPVNAWAAFYIGLLSVQGVR